MMNSRKEKAGFKAGFLFQRFKRGFFIVVEPIIIVKGGFIYAISG